MPRASSIARCTIRDSSGASTIGRIFEVSLLPSDFILAIGTPLAAPNLNVFLERRLERLRTLVDAFAAKSSTSRRTSNELVARAFS